MKDESLLRSFVEGTNDLIQSFKPDGSLEYVNTAWLETLQYSQDQISDVKLKDFVFPGYVRRMEEALSKVFRGESISDFVSTFVSKDGTPVQVEGRLFPRYQDKEVISAAGILTNINEQNRVLEELRHEQTRVEFLLDLMTHDLTNINQEILSALEVALFTPELPDILESLLQEGVNEVERGSNLISNVKKLWRIARRPPRMFRCDLGESLFAAKEIVEQSFPHKEMQLTTDFEPGVYYVTADEYLIEVFKSLLHNAMKFDTRDCVQIDVVSEIIPHTPFLKMQIQDYGPGIVDEEKSIIFDQLAHRRDSPRGLGLGLTLTKHVLENYGGYIRIEDRFEGEPEKGANFILLLRLSQKKTRSSTKQGGKK
jgi:PAS domain S-box-containing protein